MIPGAFQYFAPTTVEEAIGLLQEHGDEAKVLAGGHSLLPTMKLRLAQPGVIIDITRLKGLNGISVNGNVQVGALATYSAIASSAEIQSACKVLSEVCGQIGDIQVRNRGTLGGSLAHSDPAADLPAVALALDAVMTVQGPNGKRDIAATDMFIEMLTTAIEPEELLTNITLPHLGAGEGASYEKMRNPASRYAIVGVAAYVKLDGGSVSAARVAVTGAGVKAVRQPSVEATLVGSDGGEAAIAAAAENAGEDVDFLGDIHASEDYRRAMVKVYTRRAVARAVAQARG